MKRNIAIIISVCLIFMFLVYSGVFRDYKNPVKVTEYYLECLRNKEGFLTYPISTPEYFDMDRRYERHYKYRLFDALKMKPQLIEIKDNSAFVKVQITYKNKSCAEIKFELKKDDEDKWLINRIL